MNEKENARQKPAHNVIMENRRLLSLSGIIDVDSFDEECILIVTEQGELTVKGDALHINRLDRETGEMSIDGEISELVYSGSAEEKPGFFSRLFR